FQPSGDLYFVKSGDESNTVMGRLPILDYDFSQFDRDNMNRDLTATYINESNSILARIYASPRAGEVSSAISSADQDAAAALTAYQAMQYLTATAYAKSAYGKVLNAAAQINVPIEPEAWQADWRSGGQSYMFVDNIDDSLLDVPLDQP